MANTMVTKIGDMISRPSTRSALSCSQKMRGLNPGRNPCVQGSIRSLGFNFTDWFAPFFSVRILTRKVACAEPLKYHSGTTLERSIEDLPQRPENVLPPAWSDLKSVRSKYNLQVSVDFTPACMYIRCHGDWWAQLKKSAYIF